MGWARCTTTWSALASLAAIECLSACGSEAPPTPQEQETDADSPCRSPGETYSVGMSKTSANGKVTVELADSLPAPPGYGENKWILHIKDESGNPLAGATVNVGLRMPEHSDHVLPGTVGTDAGGGTYQVSHLNLIMAGLYNITLDVASPAGDANSVTFQFCVRRKGD